MAPGVWGGSHISTAPEQWQCEWPLGEHQHEKNTVDGRTPAPPWIFHGITWDNMEYHVNVGIMIWNME